MTETRRFSGRTKRALIVAASVLLCIASVSAGPTKTRQTNSEPLDPRAVINHAKARAIEIPKQAEALARLA